MEGAGGPVPFALTQWVFHYPVFSTIRRILPSGGRVLDVGCGAAIFTALLGHHGYEVVGVDEDDDIIAYAREMVSFFHSPTVVEHGDAFELSRHHGRFDLVYSLGVLEHFEPRVTIRLLQEQARCGRFVLLVVPTRFTCHAAPVTDEHLYGRRQVSALVRRAGLRVKESFVYGDVPTWTARVLSRALPAGVHQGLRGLLNYGMDICCVGERE